MQASRHPIHPTFLDWLPVFLAAGIIVYNALPFEPTAVSAWVIALPLPAIAVCWRRYRAGLPVAVALFVAALGFSASLWETARVATPRVPDSWKFHTVTGKVDAISLDANRFRMRLDVANIEGLAPEETPHHVRLTLRGKTPPPPVGAIVEARARMFPPSPPLMPGAFDFARYFYFREIGAVGFALPSLNVQTEAHVPSWQERIQRGRTSLAAWLLASIPQPAGGVAVSLVTGDQTAVDDKTAEAMRVSGITHILSISGMHMAIISALFFFWLRAALALVPRLPHRVDIKKLAAVIALFAAGGYLVLADFPVSAVRAYVMVALVFIGVLLGREAITLRSLTLAATVILLAQPSCLVEPGFELSFIATLALVVFYQSVVRRKPVLAWHEIPWYRRVFAYPAGLVLTSLIASAATMPFLILHFQQLSLLGVLTNLATLPLLSFVVMPFLILALFLLPFGLGGFALAVAAWGIGLIVRMAAWVASIPGAALHVPPMMPYGLLLVGAGTILVLLAPYRGRLLGAALLGVAVASTAFYTPPDVLVDMQARYIALRVAPNTWVLARGRSSRNFTVTGWQERLGGNFIPWKKWQTREQPTALTCGEGRCDWRKENHRIVVAWDAPSVQAACRENVILIAARWVHEPCDKPLRVIDKTALERHGAHAVFLSEKGVKTARSCDASARRPWSGCRP